MASETTVQPTTFHWKWVAVGVIVGLVIAGTSYFIVVPTFHSEPIQTLVLMMGFVITGAIVGYFSPGVTIREASVAGGIVALIMLAMVAILGSRISLDFVRSVLALILGVSLSWVGAWMGEELQGSRGHPEEETKRMFTDLQWRWVWIGIVLGFAINVLAVFLIPPLFNINLDIALAVFLLGFMVTGFVVGYKSPGITLKEPAIAAAIAVVLEWVFVQFIMRLDVSMGVLAFGLVLGFFLSLFGAWLGERYQISMAAKAQQLAA
jgi:hypothetical protein